MRPAIVLMSLAMSTSALAQDGNPCRSAETFNARRCAAQVTSAHEDIAAAQEAMEGLAWCSDTKKKKELKQCVADYARAYRRLATGMEVIMAASHADMDTQRGGDSDRGDGMSRPSAE